MDKLHQLTHETIRVRGRFILTLAETFLRWRGPEGQRFANQFFSEINMGKLAEAYLAEVAMDADRDKQLAAALDNNKTLTDLNAKLTAAQNSGPATVTPAVTPNGYTLDQSDLVTVDTIIAKHNVPNPTASQP